MSEQGLVIKSTTLVLIILGSFLGGLTIGGIVGYNSAPSGGEDFDLPDIGTFRMGFIPANPATVNDLTTDAFELMQFLEEEMGLDEQGIDIEVYPVNRGYEDLILAFENGEIDAAFMDSTPAYITVQSNTTEVVLAEIQAETEATFYNAAAWVRQDSPIDSLDTLVNGSFVSSHTSWTGTSGMVLPIGNLIADGYMQTQEGDDTRSLLERYFAAHIVGGGYGGALSRVMDDQADVAYVRGTLDNVPSLQDRANEVRRLHVFGKAPSHPVVVRTDLAEGWKIRFIQAMLKLNQPGNVDILQDLYGAIGLVATTNIHLADIATALQQMPWVLDQYNQ